jgi:hypothetical protein
MHDRRLLAAYIAVGLTASWALAQSPNETDNILTGGDARAWIKERQIQYLSEESCESGESWIFHVGGAGQTEICKEGETVSTPFSWSWVSAPAGETHIKIGDRVFVFDVRRQPSELAGEPPILVALLRTLRSSQDEPVEEVRLEFWQR